MTKKNWAALALAAQMITCSALDAVAAINAIWANDGGDKVAQEELRASANPTGVTNSVWNGTTIKLFGAKNEVVQFNLVLEAQSGASGVSVTFNRLTGPGGASITSSAAAGDQIFSWTTRPIELFYIRYLQLKGLSMVSYERYDERHIPKRMRRPWTGNGAASGGWTNRPDHDKFYPEIAVPLELVPTFAIAAGKSQSIWGDIYIPKTVQAGLYTGTITVSEAGGANRSIPVELTVRNFTLPDAPSAKTMMYISTSNIHKRYFGNIYVSPAGAQGSAAKQVRDRHFLIAHRHKISLIGDNNGDCDVVADRPCPEWIPRLNGSLFNAANGYDGPGVNTGNNVFSIGTYGSWGWQNQGEAGMRTHTDAWANWFNTNGLSNVQYFLFLADESHSTPQTEVWAQWLRNNPGPGNAMRSFVSSQLPVGSVQYPSVDYVASTLTVGDPAVWQPLADRYLNDSRKSFFLYNAHRPATGSTATEDDGIALRQIPWAQYKKRIPRWWIWESTYYNNYQGGSGETNVFRSAKTFGGLDSVNATIGETGWNYANGDGVMFYPGTDTVFPSDSYGVKGPFVSIRMKMWRRGLQDVDYIQMASAINPGAVQAIVNTIVPKVAWEYGVNDKNDPTWVFTDISWSTDPDVWENARKQLADIIAPAATGGGDTSPPSVPNNLAFAYPNTSGIRLNWTASTDNVAVTGYRLDIATDPSFTTPLIGYSNRDMGNTLGTILSGLQPATLYHARVRAYDAAGNTSANSMSVAIATLATDFAVQSAPVNVVMTRPSATSMSLSWSASPSPNSFKVSNYQVQISPQSNFGEFATNPWGGSFYFHPTQSATITGLTSGVAYFVRVRAHDAYGNTSNYSLPGTGGSPSGDVTPPGVPSSITFNYPNISTLRLYWGSATDNVAVTSYRLDVATDPSFTLPLAGYSNRSMGTAMTVSLDNLQASTFYYARVRAQDAAGNISANTSVAAMSTLNANYASLSAPTNVVITRTTPTSIALNWLPSTSPGSINVSNYQVQISPQSNFGEFATNPWGGSFYSASIRSASFTNLPAGVPYYARIRANDSYGNVSVYANGTTSGGAIAAAFGVPSSPSVESTHQFGHEGARVYPNPWRINLHNGNDVVFDQMAPNSTVKIFTISAQHVRTLSAPSGSVPWDLTNSSGEKVASGIYIYLITASGTGNVKGKLAIIR